MRAAVSLLAVLSLTACASISGKSDEDHLPPGGPGRASAEELHEYIANVQPKRVVSVRFKEPLRWTYINDYFAIMETRNGPHLIELAWECRDLNSNLFFSDMADVRGKRNVLTALVDTLRGCRIKSFYKLPEVDAVETNSQEP